MTHSMKMKMLVMLMLMLMKKTMCVCLDEGGGDPPDYLITKFSATKRAIHGIISVGQTPTTDNNSGCLACESVE